MKLSKIPKSSYLVLIILMVTIAVISFIERKAPTDNKVRISLPAPREPNAPTSSKSVTNQTILNEDKDIWGWFSGTYIDLHWNPYNFSTFRVYRQTNANTQWKLVSRESLKKPQYFDSDLDKSRAIYYKVEAVTEKGAILKSYTPILFQLDRENGGNHEFLFLLF
jgi:hypothetical protein